MRAVELAIGYLVTRLFERRNEPPAGRGNRQDLVLLAMRDEDPRPAVRLACGDEARRKGQDVREQIAVVETERQRVGRAVREAADGDSPGIDRDPLKRGFERAVDELHVRPVIATEDRKSTRLNSSHSQISYAVFC